MTKHAGSDKCVRESRERLLYILATVLRKGTGGTQLGTKVILTEINESFSSFEPLSSKYSAPNELELHRRADILRKLIKMFLL